MNDGRPHGPRRTGFVERRRPLNGKSRKRRRERHCMNGYRTPFSFSRRRHRRRKVPRCRFRQRKGAAAFGRERHDARLTGDGNPPPPRNRVGRRGRPHSRIQRDIRNPLKPHSERQRVFRFLPFRCRVLIRQREGHALRRENPAFAPRQLRVRLRSLMRKRHGVRKRGYGVFFGFHLFVLGRIARENLHRLNQSQCFPERGLPAHGPILSLRRREIPPHAPLLRRG